jgi:DNA-binding IclR family transcriptional regulator
MDLEVIRLSAEKLRKQAVQLLAEQPMSLSELAAKMSIKEKKAFNILKYLFENGEISSFKDADSRRRYRLADASA